MPKVTIAVPGNTKRSLHHCRASGIDIQSAVMSNTTWLLAFLYFAFLLPRLSAEDASGSVVGNVICADGNVPARGAVVTIVPLDRLLEGQRGGFATTRTDFNGAYEFLTVKPGTYAVNAVSNGYSDDLKFVLLVLANFSFEDRQKILAGLPQVTVKPGVSLHKDLILRRAAAISGRVSVDLGGIPGQVMVTATRVSGEDSGVGIMAQLQKSNPFTQSAPIDDRGAYRIAGLPSGKYRISIRVTEAYLRAISKGGEVRLEAERPGTAELTVYAPEFLNAADARIIEVTDADEISDADITVPARLLHSIGGIVTDGGFPRSGMLIEVQRQGNPAQGSNATTLEDGSYRFDLLQSGTYTVRVLRAGSSTATSGAVSVHLVDSDLLDANIELRSKEAFAP